MLGFLVPGSQHSVLYTVGAEKHRIERWMDGWADGWMDGWMCRWMDGWAGGWMDGWMDGCVDGWMDGQVDEWMDGWMDGEGDSWASGLLNAQQRATQWVNEYLTPPLLLASHPLHPQSRPFDVSLSLHLPCYLLVEATTLFGLDNHSTLLTAVPFIPFQIILQEQEDPGCKLSPTSPCLKPPPGPPYPGPQASHD